MTASTYRHDASTTPATTAVRDLVIVNSRTGRPVVTGVSFDIAAGEILGIVGESGSGKSTIGRALLGFARHGLHIKSGSVLLHDFDVLTLQGEALRSARGRLVSYVPQDPAMSLNPAHRIGDQLRESLRVHGGVLDAGESADDRIKELFSQVQLPFTNKFLKSFPHQMSGGQQQRVTIAMAFACKPRLVVLDEPTTGLDVTTQRHILDTVRELSTAHGTSAVYISHDLPVVARIADAIAVVYAGQIVEHGPTDDVVSVPGHQYTARLLRAIPSARHATKLIGIEGHSPAPDSRPEGCRFADRCSEVDNTCRESTPQLVELRPRQTVRCVHPASAQQREVEKLEDTPAISGGPGFEVKGLSASYSGRHVLHDIDFTVNPGECLGIIGESGSGKTTLARSLIGLHDAYQAEISVFGQSLACRAHERSAEDRRRMQYIFQNPFGSLNPRMTVADNIAEPLRVFSLSKSDERRAKALEVLDKVALGAGFADRMPERLSGGERQRVAVARALVVDPEILICDEVTSALDVSVQALLIEQLRQLQRDAQLTMLFITHNLAVVRSIAQKVIVLQSGRIVESGSVDEVLDNPRHPYTQQLLSDLPD